MPPIESELVEAYTASRNAVREALHQFGREGLHRLRFHQNLGGLLRGPPVDESFTDVGAQMRRLSANPRSEEAFEKPRRDRQTHDLPVEGGNKEAEEAISNDLRDFEDLLAHIPGSVPSH